MDPHHGWPVMGPPSVAPRSTSRSRWSSERVGRAVAFFASALSLACGSWGDGSADSVREPVIYGVDDRVELYSASTPQLRQFGETSVVALVEDAALNGAEPGNPRALFSTASWMEKRGLCPEVRFAQQPAAATCSGVLVSSELVMTAGHCFENTACEDVNIIFGYHYLENGAIPRIEARDVYRCRAILSSARPTVLENTDYAWILLDRQVSADKRPARILSADEAARLTRSPLNAFTFGGGLPLKVEANVRMLDPIQAERDYFVTAMDAFEGASGGPIVSEDTGVVGIVARGNPDYVLTAQGCNEVAVLAESAAAERATFAFRALDGLCDGAQDDLELCRSAVAPTANGGCSLQRNPWNHSGAVLLLLCSIVQLLLRRRFTRKQ